MTDVREITGVFRDRDQAQLAAAAAAARRQGLEVPAPEDLVEDAAGVHVILGTTGAPAARRTQGEWVRPGEPQESEGRSTRRFADPAGRIAGWEGLPRRLIHHVHGG